MVEVSILPAERDLDGAMESVEGCQRRNRERASDVRIGNSDQVDLGEVVRQVRTNGWGCRHDTWKEGDEVLKLVRT